MKAESIVHEAFRVHAEAFEAMSSIQGEIAEAGLLVGRCLASGGKLLLAGNGGSAADAQHWATEWMIRLHPEPVRRALPAIALTTDSSQLTAGANDIGFENVLARQVEGLGQRDDLLILISTSGQSENLLRAADKAHEECVKVLGILGKGGGALAEKCDHAVIVPSDDTGAVQEMHAIVGHLLCELSERALRNELEDE